MLKALDDVVDLNREIHLYATEAIEKGKITRQNAGKIIDEDVITRTDVLMKTLLEINAYYKKKCNRAESIRENVRVVRKVADGDLTAYVKIRSAEDSLGKRICGCSK